MSTHALKTNFTKGEVTPLVAARQDIELYQAGVEYIVNWLVLKHGGIRRRSGTRYIGRAKYDNVNVRFLPFIFSTKQSYALEFADNVIRFWTPFSNPPGLVESTTPGVPYEIASPYAAADVFNVQFASQGNTMYLASGGVPKQLKRISHNNWTITDYVPIDGPYLAINDQVNYLHVDVTPSSVTHNTVDLLWDNLLGLNDGAGLQAGDVGRHIRVQLDGWWYWGTIASVLSTTHATMVTKDRISAPPEDRTRTVTRTDNGTTTVITTTVHGGSTTTETITNARQSLSWRLGAWGNVPGWPRSVSLFDGRVCWGNTDLQTRGVAGTKSTYIHKFEPSAEDGTVADDHGFNFEIISGQSDPINWMQEAPRLQIGTDGAIRSIGSSDSNSAMTPRNVSQRIEIPIGASNVTPVLAGTSTIFPGRFGRHLHDLHFNFQINGLEAPPMSVLAEHMFASGVKQVAFQQVPDELLWSVTNVGTLIGTTFDKYEKVLGFHKQDVGGVVVTACAIPGPNRDELWMMVNRVIDGDTVTYVEVLQRPFETMYGMTKADAFFVDCGLAYAGAPINVLSGLGHLEGQVVDILADGAVQPRQTVTAGSITLPGSRTASKISVGLPIKCEGRLLRTPVPGPDGAVLGRKKRVFKIITDTLESATFKVGTVEGGLENTDFRLPSVPMGQAPPLFTGTTTTLVEDSFDGEAQVIFAVDQPVPVTIRAFNVCIESEP